MSRSESPRAVDWNRRIGCGDDESSWWRSRWCRRRRPTSHRRCCHPSAMCAVDKSRNALVTSFRGRTASRAWRFCRSRRGDIRSRGWTWALAALPSRSTMVLELVATSRTCSADSPCFCNLIMRLIEHSPKHEKPFNLLLVLLVRYALSHRNAGQEQDDECCEDRWQNCDPLNALDDV